MSYKFFPKNRYIDGLILGLCAAFFLFIEMYASPVKMGTSEHYWLLLIFGIVLIRVTYLAWSKFYGKNADKNPSTLFKIRKALVTFCGVAGLVLYFIYIFNFAL